MSRAVDTYSGGARDDDLPEEIVECLELYRDGRCPEIAACLLEELALGSRRAESATCARSAGTRLRLVMGGGRGSRS